MKVSVVRPLSALYPPVQRLVWTALLVAVPVLIVFAAAGLGRAATSGGGHPYRASAVLADDQPNPEGSPTPDPAPDLPKEDDPAPEPWVVPPDWAPPPEWIDIPTVPLPPATPGIVPPPWGPGLN